MKSGSELRRQSSFGWSERVVLLALMLAAFLVLRPLFTGGGVRPGTRAPSFSAEDLSGNLVKLEDFRGRLLLLDFWATWCGPCVIALPKIERVYRRYKKDGLAVLGVNQEPGQVPMLRSFMAGRDLSFPTVVDTGAIAERYGVELMPTTLLIDRDGVVQASFRGIVGEQYLSELIESLLAEPSSSGHPTSSSGHPTSSSGHPIGIEDRDVFNETPASERVAEVASPR